MGDEQYIWQHAFAYAIGEDDENPAAYADWYVENFPTMDKTPSHSLMYFGPYAETLDK